MEDKAQFFKALGELHSLIFVTFPMDSEEKRRARVEELRKILLSEGVSEHLDLEPGLRFEDYIEFLSSAAVERIDTKSLEPKYGSKITYRRALDLLRIDAEERSSTSVNS